MADRGSLQCCPQYVVNNAGLCGQEDAVAFLLALEGELRSASECLDLRELLSCEGQEDLSVLYLI